MSSNIFFRVTDVEAVAMSRYLVQHDGLFLGSSSACNLVACVKLVRQLGWKGGQTIVTILYVSKFTEFYRDSWHAIRCDSGNRHYSKVGKFLVCSEITYRCLFVRDNAGHSSGETPSTAIVCTFPYAKAGMMVTSRGPTSQLTRPSLKGFSIRLTERRHD